MQERVTLQGQASGLKQINLQQMLKHLLQVEDETWGMYAFSRELLKNRIQEDKKAEMITKAIACGKEYAEQIIHQNKSSDIGTLAVQLKLKIVMQNSLIMDNSMLFACYRPPDIIEIMEEPVSRAALLVKQETPAMAETFQQRDMLNIILGHEIYHFLEEKFAQKIYTRMEKILLWNVMGIKNYSTIRALGEIGAMAFTKELNGLQYSPFLLDILLYYGYDSFGAEKIYHDVLEMHLGRCGKIEE